MYYRMKVAGLERDLPICPVNDKLYIAGFVIFGDQELTVACARELLARQLPYRYVLVPLSLPAGSYLELSEVLVMDRRAFRRILCS